MFVTYIFDSIIFGNLTLYLKCVESEVEDEREKLELTILWVILWVYMCCRFRYFQTQWACPCNVDFIRALHRHTTQSSGITQAKIIKKKRKRKKEKKKPLNAHVAHPQTIAHGWRQVEKYSIRIQTAAGVVAKCMFTYYTGFPSRPSMFLWT